MEILGLNRIFVSYLWYQYYYKWVIYSANILHLAHISDIDMWASHIIFSDICSSYWAETRKNAIFLWFKGRNSEVSWSNWLIIKLDLDVIAFHIFMKYCEDTMTIAGVIEQKPEKTQLFDDSKVVTQECLGQFGRLSNLA